MNDKELIHKFLNKNFSLIADRNSIKIFDLNTDKKIAKLSFRYEIERIFGTRLTEYGSPVDIFNQWFNEKSYLITKNLADFIEKQDFNIGSLNLIELCVKKFYKNKNTNKTNDCYEYTFIENYVEKEYIQKHIIPKLQKHTEIFNKSDGSVWLVKSFIDNLKFESINVEEFCVEYLNNWYNDTILLNKLNSFFNELVVTLGKSNWIVTRIGHGPLNKDTLLKHFPDEREEQHTYILKTFDKWYEGEIIDYSERLLNRNNYGETFPSLNLDRKL